MVSREMSHKTADIHRSFTCFSNAKEISFPSVSFFFLSQCLSHMKVPQECGISQGDVQNSPEQGDPHMTAEKTRIAHESPKTGKVPKGSE